MVKGRPINEWNYQEYLSRKKWKCSKSPTGAHYWKGDETCLICEYCGKKKDIDSSKFNTGYTMRRNENVDKNHKKL